MCWALLASPLGQTCVRRCSTGSSRLEECRPGGPFPRNPRCRAGAQRSGRPGRMAHRRAGRPRAGGFRVPRTPAPGFGVRVATLGRWRLCGRVGLPESSIPAVLAVGGRPLARFHLLVDAAAALRIGVGQAPGTARTGGARTAPTRSVPMRWMTRSSRGLPRRECKQAPKSPTTQRPSPVARWQRSLSRGLSG